MVCPYALLRLAKRFVAATAIYNLSQLLRALFGMGTPKQARALTEKAKAALQAAAKTVEIAGAGLVHP